MKNLTVVVQNNRIRQFWYNDKICICLNCCLKDFQKAEIFGVLGER